MREGPLRARPERSELLRQLRSRLSQLEDPLEIIAEQLLGLDARIDFVAGDRSGQVVLIFLAEPGSDLVALANALAQRAWTEPRVADWLKLAPQLDLRPELGVRVLLLAPQLDPRTVAAAQSVKGADVTLGICRCIQRGPEFEILIEMLGSLPADPPRVAAPIASRFRTGLRAEELHR